MDAAALAALEPAALRAVLPDFLAGHLTDPVFVAQCRARMGEFAAGLADEDARRLLTHLVTLGDEPRVYLADPAARKMCRMWCRDVLVPGDVIGAEHLDGDAPTLIVSNHLSYIDATATDAILAWAGRADLADRLVAIAGPKVYDSLFRRLAAACLNTLPTPQSASVAGAQLGPRELAARAAASVQLAHAELDAGRILLLYAEGSRTRTGRLRPFLRAVWRYLDHPGARVVPLAITGTDTLFPIGAERLGSGPTALRFGAPFLVAAHPSPRAALEAAWSAVASLLPPERRPEIGDAAVG